jgi:tetratricopeptide (TPR) repeat protein
LEIAPGVRDHLLDRSASYEKVLRPDLAMADLRNAAGGGDWEPELRSREARLRYQTGDRNGIEALLTDGQSDSLKILAKTQEYAGHPAAALQYWSYQVAKYPDFWPSHMDLCDARIRAGAIDSGLQECEVAVAVSKHGAEAIADFGIELVLAGRPADARRVARTAQDQLTLIALVGDQTSARNSLAKLWNVLAEYGLGRDSADRAIAANPEFLLPLRHKAYALWKLGQGKDAIGVLDDLIKRAPYYGLAYHTRAEIEAALGDSKGAAADDRRFQQLREPVVLY